MTLEDQHFFPLTLGSYELGQAKSSRSFGRSYLSTAANQSKPNVPYESANQRGYAELSSIWISLSWCLDQQLAWCPILLLLIAVAPHLRRLGLFPEKNPEKEKENIRILFILKMLVFTTAISTSVTVTITIT